MLKINWQSCVRKAVQRKLSVAVLTALVFGTVMTTAGANNDKLPLKDGAYLRDPQWCVLYHHNELDFIDFEVGNEGRSFGFIEVGCLVFSVKKVRETRYLVEADCTEAGEVYQKTLFLDVNPDRSLRIDGGELHHFCEPPKNPSRLSKSEINALRAKMYGVDPSVYSKTEEPDEPASTANLDDLISDWHEENEGCRGGSGDDPNTEKACDRRSAIALKIEEIGWCYGKEGEFG